jgi:hypothetical protein
MHQDQDFHVAFKQQKELEFLCISPSNAESHTHGRKLRTDSSTQVLFRNASSARL